MSETPTDRSDSTATSAGGGSAADESTGDAATDTEADDPTPTDGPTAPDGPVASGEGRARDVVVPMALYKRVTAYATLTAVVTVVFGFILLDAATLNVSLTRRFVVGVLATVGVAPPETFLTALFSVLGLGSIAFGAGVYVLGSRFRAAGMSAENGNPQDDDAEV
ncbi:DUF7315 family membrane protein [Halobaculum limi]|uniref:DUF7315 family membrane protein n=1 Tax=Halobaculum limi TaxID=3031916 RepID=UPI0024057089|nr:hypothetical protein [Halobaculum sp. YSMS11]